MVWVKGVKLFFVYNFSQSIHQIFINLIYYREYYSGALKCYNEQDVHLNLSSSVVPSAKVIYENKEKLSKADSYTSATLSLRLRRVFSL